MRFSCSSACVSVYTHGPYPSILYLPYSRRQIAFIRAKPRRRPCDEGIFNSADRSAIVRVTSRVPWCTRFYQGSQRQISTVNTTGSVPTVFFPRNALSRRAYSADITFQAAINDFLLLQTLRILQYRSIDPFITFILVNILTDSTSVTIFRKCIAR